MELDFSKKINDSDGLKGLITSESQKRDINLLPDSEFAYIEQGGELDSFNRTVPLSLRHFPIANQVQVEQSLSQISEYALSREAKSQAFEKILSKAKSLGIEVSESAMPPWLKKKGDEKKDGEKKDGKKKEVEKDDAKKSLKKATAPAGCPECY